MKPSKKEFQSGEFGPGSKIQQLVFLEILGVNRGGEGGG